MIRILCIFAFIFAGCDQKPQVSQYKEIVVQAPQVSAPGVASTPAAAADQAMSADHMFTWGTPDGWEQEAATGMRLATFQRIADAKAIDCSIVTLGPMAGGLDANLRRWMGQIGVKTTDDQLSKLISSAPGTKIKSGQEGRIFDFTSIKAKTKPSDKSMIVVMVPMDQATLFIKMTGTVDTVVKNRDIFFKLVGSVEFHAPSSDTGPATVGLNPAGDPHAGLDMSAMGGLIEAPTQQNILSWKAPEGWAEEAGKHMRMVSFHAVADPNAIDCYIIALAGPAGGLEANLQRWLGQLGLQPTNDHVSHLTASAQSVMTRDGLQAQVFDFTSQQAQGSPSDKSMIAAMIPLDKTTVFVKMNGTIDSVKKNKDQFIKLIGSIARK